jgi:peptidoglycan/LPS O-acetylase OafA/YrhL
LAVLAGCVFLAVSLAEFAGCLLFVRNYYPLGMSRWYTVHYWSLSLEEHFYLGFPILLAWCRPARAVWLLPLLAVGVGTLRAAGPWLIELSEGRLPPGTFFWTRTHVRLDALLWGCWVAVLCHRYPVALRRLPGWLGPLLAAIVAASLWLPAAFTLRSLVIPWMLAATVLNPSAFLSRLLEWRTLRWVGRLSYSLYLWQQLFFVSERANLAPALTPWQAWPFNLLGLFALATLSYYLVERPLVIIGHRFARPPTFGPR